MILFYTSLLFILGTIQFLVKRRVAFLERKYARTAAEADQLLAGDARLGPSGHRLDTCENAKRQFLLGQLVQKRDALEIKHHQWLARAEKTGDLLAGVRAWKGRKLPYTMGVVDVSCLMYAIDYFGVGEYVSLHNLLQLANAVMSQ